MTVIRRVRVVPAKLEDDVIPTYDPYHALADKALLTRHGSPGFVDTALLADKAVTSSKGSPGFVNSVLLADKAVTSSKASPEFIHDSHFGSLYPQSGSVKCPGYFVYPKAYSRLRGWPVACKIDSWDESTYPLRVARADSGSCYVTGSPGGYAAVYVVGDL